MDLLRPTVFFGQKLLSKVAILKKNKNATIAFFLFSTFPCPHSLLFCFPFPSLL